MTTHGELRVTVVRQEQGGEPQELERVTQIKRKRAQHVARVTYRAGTSISRNYCSVTLQIEVQLPVALKGPFGSAEYDREAVEAGLREATEIAEQAYEKEAQELPRVLRQLSKQK